ncbi:MAG: hypothetical protein WBQ21_02915 [Solirubrobacteraceae bacterium]
MRRPRAPVKTGAGERAPRSSQSGYVDPELPEPQHALVGQLELIPREGYEPVVVIASTSSIAKRGEVVVAEAGECAVSDQRRDRGDIGASGHRHSLWHPDRAAISERRASLAKEISRTERAIECYQDAFEDEDGNLNPARFKQRIIAPTHAWEPYNSKTKHSPANSPQTHPQRPTRKHCTPSLAGSTTSLRTASPSKPKHS